MYYSYYSVFFTNLVTMKSFIHKGISIFISALLLFLFVEKSLHELDHVNDFHCTASEKHIHNQEHTCSLCDFNITIQTFVHTTEQTVQSLSFTEITVVYYFSDSHKQVALSPARAPPVVYTESS